MASARDVAEWMFEHLKQTRMMYQETVAMEITGLFGQEFVYYNNNGNLAIDSKVLREFRKLTPDTVVWHRRERYWRFKEPGEGPGRLAEY